MGNEWATFGRDLHLDLTAARPTGPAGSRRDGIRAALTDALREAVRGGRLAPGVRLPSSRTLAADLGLARNTVAEAYADLVAEGWLSARQGSGTRVAAVHAEPRAGARAPGARSHTPRAPRPPEPRPATRHDLTPGTPDLSAFPRSAWLSATRRALSAAPNEAFGHPPPFGRPELRAALADYLARARGVRADPERVVVCAGFTHGLRTVGRVLRAAGVYTAAVESYGLPFHGAVLRRAGLRTTPLTVDAHGARVADLGAPAEEGRPAARAALLTPAHQFPTGVTLDPARRGEVVAWARSVGGLVLEDDYDGEFRYDRGPVGALQGLDPDRVVYLGTASKSLAPALRLAWMVVPDHLVDAVRDAVGSREGQCGQGEGQPGALDQLVLAEFLTSGAYDRHLRGMRSRYRRRRDAFVAAVAEHAPHLRVTGIAAGLHALLELPPGTEATVVRAARWQGLAVAGLSDLTAPDAAAPARDALVVAYGRPPGHAFPGALRALLGVLSAV